MMECLILPSAPEIQREIVIVIVLRHMAVSVIRHRLYHVSGVASFQLITKILWCSSCIKHIFNHSADPDYKRILYMCIHIQIIIHFSSSTVS